MKKLYALICCTCSAAVLLALGHLVYLYTHCRCTPADFRHPCIQKRHAAFAPDDELKEHVRKLLSQKFTYYRCGKQMTAFESEDHQYVLKFFNPRAFLRKEWFSDLKKLKRFCSLKWLSHTYFKRGKRLEQVFHCHDLAFCELQQEAGILYVHLNPLSCLSKEIDLIDADGKAYHFDLDDTPFVLQKKAQLCTDRFQELVNQSDHEGIMQGLAQLQELFEQRAAKGFTDRIQTLHNNYGFTDDGAIQIDLGRIRKESSVATNREEEIKRIFADIALRYPLISAFVPLLLKEMQEDG